jgi:hypothetical protein
MHNYILNTFEPKNQFVASKDASMANDRFSKKIIAIMDGIVNQSAKHDSMTTGYELLYDEIDELDLELLTAQLFIEQESIASECTGPDNELYDSKMLPALITLLQNSTDRDSQIEFIKEWKRGAASYAKFKLSQLLEWRLEYYNADMPYNDGSY